MNKGKMAGALVVGLALVASLTWANGLNLNSLGTRALTMGGAYVGLANDFSAVFWNPAGAGFFKTKTFGFYGTDMIPTGTYKFEIPLPNGSRLTMVDAKTNTKHYLGALAAYYHPVGENLVVGLGVYTPSGLGADWDGTDFASLSLGKSYEWTSMIGVVTISPLIAYRVNDMISVGATLNVNYGMFNIKTHAGSVETALGTLDLGQYEESLSGWALGATFGVLVKPSDMFSFGLTFKTPFNVKLGGEANISNLPLLKLNGQSDLDREVTWPMWLAGGVAFKPIPKLTLTGDIQYTQWSTIDTIDATYKDTYWAAFMGSAGKDKMAMEWQSKSQIRFGAEYMLSPALALRAGYYWDPAPAPDKTMNVLIPSYNFNVLTFGVGYASGNLQLDFGVEYLMGSERSVDYIKTLTDTEWADAMPGVYGMKLLVPNLSISYRF
ncbi:MAG: outer membrane protein transport protein [Candidatus Aminicenantes bacterium]|nr:outer membrane protein transport protein [Candidatus Aminicenantes bacterium]